MLWAVFVSFAAIILSLRFLRRIYAVRTLAADRAPLTLPETHRRPYQEYHDKTWLPLCNRVAEAVSARLERPLTKGERRAIWRSRSELVLEVVLKEVREADAQAAAALLVALPPGMDRPDPTRWCDAA